MAQTKMRIKITERISGDCVKVIIVVKVCKLVKVVNRAWAEKALQSKV